MKEMTDRQAQRFIEWALSIGCTREQANEGLAYIMGASKAKPPDNKEGSQPPTKQT